MFAAIDKVDLIRVLWCMWHVFGRYVLNPETVASFERITPD